MHEDEARPYKMLISAVVAKAVQDTFLPPIKTDKGMHIALHAMTALDFLYGDNLKYWLQFLDIDDTNFVANMERQMFNTSKPTKKIGKNNTHEIDDSKRRMFKTNYKLWKKLKASRALGMYQKEYNEWNEQ